MKKIRPIFIITMILGIVSIGNVYADSTVLYNDGTLIINEKSEDRDSNIEEHGEVIKEYLPLSEENDYVFNYDHNVLWYGVRSHIKKVEIGQKVSPVSTSYWFYRCSNLIKVDLRNLDTSQVTDMSYMFWGVSGGAKNWTILGMSNWDTSKVKDMSYMFYGTGQLAITDNLEMLKIPSYCKLDYFAAHAHLLNANFEISGSLSDFYDFGYHENMFLKTSDLWPVKTNLYYNDEAGKELAEELIYRYGSNGSISQGNIEIGKFKIEKIGGGKILDEFDKEVYEAEFLKKLKLSFNVPEFYMLEHIKIYNESNEDITELVNFNEEDYSFIMPNYNIKVDISYVRHPDVYEISWGWSGYGETKVPFRAYKNNKVQITAIPERVNRIKEIIISDQNGTIINDIVKFDCVNNTFIMPGYNIKVSVVYEKIKYNFFSEHTKGGDISASGEATYNEEIVFAINVDSGYIIRSIKVINISNNKDVSDIVNLDKKHWTFIMPDYDVKVKVIFAKRPCAPKTVTTKLYGHDDVKFSWSKVSGADGYLIYYKKSTSKNYTLFVATTATSIKRANLTDGIKYYFKVVPYVKDVNGTKRYNTYKVSSIYTLKKLNSPKVTKYSKYYVKIKWNNISGESGYQIARKKYGSSTYYVVKNVSYKYSSTTLKTTRNKTYYYKIRAYKIVDGKKIYGPWSNVKSYKLK